MVMSDFPLLKLANKASGGFIAEQKTAFTKNLFANIGAICNFTAEFNGLVSKSEPFRFHGVAHLLLYLNLD